MIFPVPCVWRVNVLSSITVASIVTVCPSCANISSKFKSVTDDKSRLVVTLRLSVPAPASRVSTLDMSDSV